MEEYAAGAADHGVPEEFVGFLTYQATKPRTGSPCRAVEAGNRS